MSAVRASEDGIVFRRMLSGARSWALQLAAVARQVVLARDGEAGRHFTLVLGHASRHTRLQLHSQAFHLLRLQGLNTGQGADLGKPVDRGITGHDGAVIMLQHPVSALRSALRVYRFTLKENPASVH